MSREQFSTHTYIEQQLAHLDPTEIDIVVLSSALMNGLFQEGVLTQKHVDQSQYPRFLQVPFFGGEFYYQVRVIDEAKVGANYVRAVDVDGRTLFD